MLKFYGTLTFEISSENLFSEITILICEIPKNGQYKLRLDGRELSVLDFKPETRTKKIKLFLELDDSFGPFVSSN